jgi:PAS domain S-box-containing protein
MERVGLWLCVAGAALGAFGLVDELLGLRVWASLLPSQPPMRANSALGLLLVGGAAALRCWEDSRWWRRTMSTLAALAALSLGLVTLAEYSLATNLRIDRLLAFGQPEPYSGRPGPLAALGLALLAAAVLLFDAGRAARARPMEWLAFSAGVVAFIGLLGCAFGAAMLYRMIRAPLIGMAPGTAIALLLTSTGLLLQRPAAGLIREATAPGPGGLLLKRLIPATILGPALVGLAIVPVLRALEVDTAAVLGAVLAACMTGAGLVLLVSTAAPLNRAHEALESSRTQLRILVDQAPDGIFVANLDGRYIDVNSAGCRILGLGREEIIGKAISDLIPHDKVAQLELEKKRLVAGEEVVSDWLLRKKDGSWLPVEVNAKILPDGRWQGFVRDLSERRRLEAALHASHADLVRAQSVADVGSWRLDVQHEVAQWSDELYRMFGLAPGTPMTYQRFFAFVHPDDRASLAADWAAALRGQVFDSEHRIVVDGAVKWVRQKADLEFDQNHRLIGGMGVTLHITDRKRREEELRQTRERLELALAGADLALWDWNVASGEVVFNERWAEMRGYRPEEIRGHVDSWMSGVHPEDWPRVQQVLEECLEGRRAEYEAEHRVRTKSGQWIWILDRGKVVARNERGEAKRMTGTELDVTSRKRLESEQRFLSELGSVLASTLELPATLASIGQLATVALADVCVVYVMEVGGEVRPLKAVCREAGRDWICEALTRMPLDRSRAQAIWSALSANRSVLMTPVAPEMIEALSPGDEQRHALRALDPSSIILAPLFARGRLVGALALIAATPTRAYAPVDVRFAEQIAQRAAHAIDNAQLYGAAKRAILARDSVLGIVAHDLRSPLGTILIQAQLLRRPGGQPDRRSSKPADVIARAGTRMNRIIQDLLDVTRVEEGGLKLEQGRVAASQVISDSVEAQQALVTAASLQVELEVAPDLPEVWADRDRLLQILENLVGNAIKFTDAGGRLRIGAAPRDGQVLFWVADTGAGITAEDLPHVFDRFWQGRQGERRGVGIGLAIVKGLVEGHGGQIWVESSSGRGATFFFTLPSAPPRAQPRSLETAAPNL